MMPMLRLAALVLVCSLLWLSGCASAARMNEADAAPPPAKVEEERDVSVIQVSHPERFRVVTAEAEQAIPQLSVTGVVSPDVSRNIPVISLAAGRVIELRSRLGDYVDKGQLLLRIQSADVAAAFAEYQKALADEQLARRQLERSKLLLDHGAIAQKDYEVAAGTEEKAQVDVKTTRERLTVLGARPDQPVPAIDILAPATGTIVEQNVVTAGGVKTLDNSPNLLTIADLSYVWILCDVYENDLPAVRIGEFASVRLNAYPDRVFRARISNIGAILDPNLRTAKVRLELRNPGMLMRVGMFATADFFGNRRETRAAVPASAVLHLHDRDWVYVPESADQFRRREVRSGAQDQQGRQEILAGLKPGERVVENALQLSGSLAQ